MTKTRREEKKRRKCLKQNQEKAFFGMQEARETGNRELFDFWDELDQLCEVLFDCFDEEERSAYNQFLAARH